MTTEQCDDLWDQQPVTTDADCLTTGKAVLSRDVATEAVDAAVQL